MDKAVLKSLSQGMALSDTDFRQTLMSMLKGESESEAIAAFLLGLEMIGLTDRDIRIGTEVMRANMVPVNVSHDVIDIVGTGGTGLHTLSISTATALVAAGAGAKVAKHGNRAASSLTGTADTLSTLGVNLDVTPERAAKCVDEAGIGFLFSPNHHPAMRHVGPARKALGIRTLFNILGPLSNPARAQRQLLGVSEDRFREPIARALCDLGVQHVWVVHGEDGLDEITTTGTTYVSEIKNGTIKSFTVHPSDFGIPKASLSDIRGGAPEENARTLRELLDGQPSPYRDIVVLNAAAALMIAGLVPDIAQGLEKARNAIDIGAARQALDTLIEITNHA